MMNLHLAPRGQNGPYQMTPPRTVKSIYSSVRRSFLLSAFTLQAFERSILQFNLILTLLFMLCHSEPAAKNIQQLLQLYKTPNIQCILLQPISSKPCLGGKKIDDLFISLTFRALFQTQGLLHVFLLFSKPTKPPNLQWTRLLFVCFPHLSSLWQRSLYNSLSLLQPDGPPVDKF